MHLYYLHANHTEELVKQSGIDLNIAWLNFKTLEDTTAYNYLLISNHLQRTNTGMVTNGLLQRYEHLTAGGWWCCGLDPLNNWQEMEWGCFKPNQPRQNKDGKCIKYEHPPHTPTRIFCLRVTLQIWQKVARRYNLPIPDISITSNGEAEGFWQWVMQQKIPIIICEGVKKAAALLSQGYVAIGIPGITSAYRVAKDEFGKVINRQLIPDLAAFTISKRTFYICFDFETEPHKISAINNAICQIGFLLGAKNCPVQVVQLPGIEKGVDDFIVAKGVNAFEIIYRQSINLEIYLAQTKPHSELTIPETLTVDRPYLGEISFPVTGLVGVKSAKGTGKTTALQTIVNQAKTKNQPVLLITHRIQLGRFLCEKIGIQWGLSSANSYLLGLCVDSLWKLNPEDWQGGIIILDEVEQTLWHLLNSDTCKEKRVKILNLFQKLIYIVLHTGGLIIAQDADLSDSSLEYLSGLAEIKLQPWVILNKWKPEKGWDVTFYDSPNPTPLIQQLELDLMAGRKCYVTTDSRSGRYSCEVIEKYLKERLQKLGQQFPKSLVVSSHTTNTPSHEAVDFVAAINQKVPEYGAVFVTPTIGTGVSIDIEHFDKVYGIFQGVIPDSEARQALARVRDNVPRVVWCAKRGIGLIGSGSTNYRLLSYWYQENHKENLALLNPLQKIDVDLHFTYDPIHLRTWAKFAAKVNSSISLYRSSFKQGLIADGHKIWVRSNDIYNNIVRDLRFAFLATDPKDLETRKRLLWEIFKLQKDWSINRQKVKDIDHNIKEIKRRNQLNLAKAVAKARDIDCLEYEEMLAKHSLNNDQRNQINKYVLKQKYGIEITPSLKLKDDQGYYSQLLTHYYLTHASEYFHFKDKESHHQLSGGEGKVFLPDLKNYTLKIEALRTLGIVQFLESGREFRENDPDLVLLKNTVLQCSEHIRRVLNINLVKSKKQISIINILKRLLNLLGLKLKQVNNIYRIAPESLNDGRDEIFTVWHRRDQLTLIHVMGQNSEFVEKIRTMI